MRNYRHIARWSANSIPYKIIKCQYPAQESGMTLVMFTKHKTNETQYMTDTRRAEVHGEMYSTSHILLKEKVNYSQCIFH